MITVSTNIIITVFLYVTLGYSFALFLKYPICGRNHLTKISRQLANWIYCFHPFAIWAIKEVMIEGLLSIQAGENPRVIEEKLKSFLSPADKEAMDAGGGDLDG